MTFLRTAGKSIVMAISFSSLTFIFPYAVLGIDLGSVPHYDSIKKTEEGKNVARELDSVLKDTLSKRVIFNRIQSISDSDAIVTRGAKEITLFKRASHGVVLVITNEGFGSGVLISNDGSLLTNWHVVAGYEEVGIIFKPHLEGQKITSKDVRRAKVVRVDEISDLALLKVSSVPRGATVLQLGNINEVQIGADVNAIGHPTGESWSYTKGIVSQIRKDYEWATEDTRKHKADVIQTQTPINPGNSGGPLLSSTGLVIGLNSFKTNGEGLNFAVSVSDLRRFLARDKDRYLPAAPQPVPSAPKEKSCEVTILGEQRNKEDNAKLVFFDANCDGKPDSYLMTPDDSAKGISLYISSKGDGKIDVIIYDENRDGKWDWSLWDSQGNGKPDLICYHDDGNIKASRCEQYQEKAN